MNFLSKVSFLFLFFLFLFLPSNATAASSFTTDYHVIYTIRENGMAEAVVNATLTNTSSDYYATSYTMQLGLDSISSVKARDDRGPIYPDVKKTEDGYVITLPFNNKAVGINSKQNFIVTFETPTLARHYGNIWDVSVPGIANPDDYKSFIVELKTPAKFGEPVYIKPQQPTKSLIFTKETLGRSGISISFGDKQVYDFSLKYHIRNPNLYPITTEIALPPTTNYQTVAITDIDPKPLNVIQDEDGNWLAQYRLRSIQNLDINVRGKAEVKLHPDQVELTPQQRQTYLQPNEYWEADTSQIRELADELRTPEVIYAFVVKTLSYDFDRVTGEQTRFGAVGALKNEKAALCREYTDLFIALARAAGIPAREIDGFAYTENPELRPLSQEKDILHVWPEYYDDQKKTWIMVDPTWGSTTAGVDYFKTLDLSHFAFAIKGLDSTYPIPAGGYKFANQESSKDVEVAFTTDEFSSTSSFDTEGRFPDVAIAGLPIDGKIRIANTGSAYLPSQLISVLSEQLAPGEQVLTSDGIPPFGYIDVPARFNAPSALTNTEAAYTIRVAGATDMKRIQVSPFLLTPMGGGITIGIFALIILITAIKGRRVHLSRQR